MVEMLSELKMIDLVAGAMFALTGLMLLVSYLPTSISVRRWSIILSLVSIAAAMRLMMMSYSGQTLTLENVFPFY